MRKSKRIFPPDLITVSWGTNDWKYSEFEDFANRCSAFFESLTQNYPQTPILAIAPIWRADLDESRAFGSFSKTAEFLKEISTHYKNVLFLDGINFLPRDISYYRDSHLHPNDKGFESYTNSLAAALKSLDNKFLNL